MTHCNTHFRLVKTWIGTFEQVVAMAVGFLEYKQYKLFIDNTVMFSLRQKIGEWYLNWENNLSKSNSVKTF